MTSPSLASGQPLSRTQVQMENRPASPWARNRGKICRWYKREGEIVIYVIYKDGEILVETDDLEYVRSFMRQNQECSVRDARTGKKVATE
jgi:hypothetical protein